MPGGWGGGREGVWSLPAGGIYVPLKALFLVNKSAAGMHDTPPHKVNSVQMHRIS